eukprot:CAMPEP_0195320638 /NCGR_PEP_ID=MMETSP0708-20121125/6197_1 /TAXON_ID=33640 /ORGANISM="Asterionellopsis glacialis, Strain CCMP134" /LENGTH=118 /DNA_ID=CAMNT_0040387035 /DNA_START=24 /DNA_END=380 /DNA_ORIENTATION=+
MISSLSALAAIAILSAPGALAQSCSQQAAQLQDQQSEAQQIAETRLSLVDEVEAAGDAWENAEAMRHFGAEEAEEANATKMEYEALKTSLMQKEATLQALVVTLNDQVAAYNTKCVRN